MHVLIVGNGIAGATAALSLRELRPKWRITMVSEESDHPYARTALMYVFMGHVPYAGTKLVEDRVWDERRIERVRDRALALDPAAKRVRLQRGGEVGYDRLLLCLGSKPNRFGWPGQDLDGVQGLYGLTDLVRLERTVERARCGVIVGGGLIGVELAEMLLSRRVHPTVLVRDAGYWGSVLPREECELVGEELRRHGVELRCSTELESIEDDGEGRACAVRTTSGERIEAELVGLTAGVAPNLDLVAGGVVPTERGVLVDARLRTDVPDVWAAGDCAEIRGVAGSTAERGLVQQVWYTARAQGRVAARSIAGEDARYEPGIWFNSAKFFDLEYQTYGDVRPAGQESLWWRHPSRAIALRIAHEGGRVVGFNFLGTRRRHDVCERWIAEGRDVDHVLAHLGECGFDPEFMPRFDRAAAAALGGRS